MMKKLMAALLTITLAFSPVGTYVFQDHSESVDARGYKSGKRSFNSNNNNNSNFQNKETKKSNATTSNKAKSGNTFAKGGLMKGLMLGGLAGLLFGSLFANMGMLGSILGLLINVMAVVVLIVVIRKIFTYFKDKKKKEDPNPWRG
ncbi:putative lipid-binding transport protein (Tim44 family) [Peribacillus frigoritolerans]|nr:putative lipid-binding transport protein (Tim44 family) [Peribacillus frigoritolerans]